jgi:hypothetical protein
MGYEYNKIDCYDFFDDEQGKSINSIIERRSYYRKKIATLFLQEKEGAGRGNLASRYKYYVEKITHTADSTEIFLNRPANLNKGFDFAVTYTKKLVPSNSGQRMISTPTHKYIEDTIRQIIISDKKLVDLIRYALEKYYECREPERNMWASTANYHDAELVCKTTKWLFMEQDLAYWNYSGRDMFYNSLKETINNA